MSKPQFDDWNIKYEEFLYTKTLEMNAQLVYEVGVCHGYSTKAILGALEQTGGRLVSCDVDDCRVTDSPRWTFIQTNSADFIAHLDAEADMIYVDGDHSYGSVLSDVIGLWPLLKVGGLMILDDTVNFPGPREVMAHLRDAGLETTGPFENTFGLLFKREGDPDSLEGVIGG